MKGISAVIATILLLMITIAIASTAYMYVTGMLGGKTAKTISIQHASCNGADITVIVKNTGTTTISNTVASNDLTILVDNVDHTANFDKNGVGGTTTYDVAPQGNVMLISDNGGAHYASGTHTLMTVTPSHSISQTVYC